MSKKKKDTKKGDLLDFMLERALKIDLLLDLYFEVKELVRPGKDSGEIWIDTIVKSKTVMVEDYYYKNDLVLTVINTGIKYEIQKGFKS